jgi:ribose transport system substrate-binding protein
LPKPVSDTGAFFLRRKVGSEIKREEIGMGKKSYGSPALRRWCVRLLSTVLFVGVANAASAGNYTYNSDQPDATKIFGSDLAKTLGEFEQAPGIKIGVVLKTLDNQYWQGLESGVKAAAAKYHVEVTIQAGSTESSATQQLTIAQTLFGKGFSAFILAPESTSNLVPALKQIQDAGLPVINPDDARIPATVYVGPSHLLAGGQAADYIASKLPDGGKIVQIEGQAGSSAAILRIKGFTEGLAKHSNLTLVASVPGNWDGAQAYNATQNLLRKYPDLKGIYANNDTMAVGAAKAVADAGLGGKIVIVGTDGIPAAMDAIQRGAMSATITALPYYEGYWSVEAAVRLLSGQKVPDWIVAPAQLIDKNNISTYFDKEYNVKAGLFE